MKIKYIMFGIAALALLAGCSKSKTEVETPVSPDEAWVYDESLPVPVTISSTQITAETKAIVEGTTLQEGMEFGVYGLAAEYSSEETPKVNNDAWNPDSDPSSILLNNSKATYTSSSFTFEEKTYYPMNSDLNFAFVAYFPYSESAGYLNNIYSVAYDLNTQPDIMWAYSTATSLTAADPVGRFGFNASYIRRITKNNADNYKPKLEFNHKLTALTFSVKTSGTAPTVTHFELNGVYTTATLTIAGRADRDTESGTVSGTNSGTLVLKNNDSETLAIVPDPDGEEMGTLLVCPGTSDLKASITLLSGDGTETTIKDITISAPSGGFIEGTRYAVNLTVKSMEEVLIENVSIKDWNNGTAINVGEIG